MSSADLTTALLYVLNDPFSGYSALIKVFGNPVDYAWKLSNTTYSGNLPLNIRMLSILSYDYFHSLTVDNRNQIVYYGNNNRKQIQKGLFIYNNDTRSYYFYSPPPTTQVSEQ